MPWKTDGDYIVFDGTVYVSADLPLKDPHKEDRRELAAVTSQGFADCVYPPSVRTRTADEYTLTFTTKVCPMAIPMLMGDPGPQWQTLGKLSE